MKLKDCVSHLQIKFTKLHELCFCSSKDFPEYMPRQSFSQVTRSDHEINCQKVKFFFQFPGGYCCIFNWQYVGSSSHFWKQILQQPTADGFSAKKGYLKLFMINRLPGIMNTLKCCVVLDTKKLFKLGNYVLQLPKVNADGGL